MNRNEESLISHALMLYELQYNDNIELRYCKCNYSNKKYYYIEVGERNIQDSYILRVYDWFGGFDMSIYESRNTLSNLDINIRSFINHWMRYYNFNKKINRVAVRECYDNTFDIAILRDDYCWYDVLGSPLRWDDDWIMYNW